MLTVFAALLHDFGKSTVLFQDKLKGKNKTKGDPLRHEWVSLLFLLAIVDKKSDEEWLGALISNDIHQKISKLKVIDYDKPLNALPPVASMVGWLILSHHKLPAVTEKYKGKEVCISKLFGLISPSWEV